MAESQSPAGRRNRRPSGMRAFMVIWAGQVVSLIGTSVTQFAITLWAWEVSGQATVLALVAFFSFTPSIIMSPLAGALVDRWNRRLVMMLSDLAAGAVTIFFLFLSLNDSLEIWHLYVGGAIAGTFGAFQFPAYSAAITMMVDKSQYARTSALLSLAESGSGILAPLIGAAVYVLVGLEGVFAIDIVTFSFAVLTLLIVHIPQPQVSEDDRAEGKGDLLTESLYGFRYIVRRRSLLGLQLVFFIGNLLSGFVFVLIPAMILAKTDNNEILLASVSTSFAVGGLVGGLAMSAWGGFRRRIHGVLGGWLLSGLTIAALGAGQSQLAWIAAGLAGSATIPLVNASNQAIWQSKVAPHLQGRVFSARRLIAQITTPLALLLTGPLADQVFEPAMQNPDSVLAQIFGGVVGVGHGSGMALIIFSAGALIALSAAVAYALPFIRDVETLIPDHQAKAQTTTPEAGEPETSVPLA